MLPQIYPTALTENGRPRIRTFHGRRGRLSATRIDAFENLVPQFLLNTSEAEIDLRKTLNQQEIYLDFGCGMGGHTIDLLNQGKAVVAIDVHTAGICDLAQFAHLQKLDTMRLFHGDGIDLLEKLTNNSIRQIDVYFPDPWPKARHAKRRLFTQKFLHLAHNVLANEGRIILITDDDNYAQMASVVIEAQSLFDLVPFSQKVTMTTFHQRALRLGHKIHKFELVKK